MHLLAPKALTRIGDKGSAVVFGPIKATNGRQPDSRLRRNDKTSERHVIAATITLAAGFRLKAGMTKQKEQILKNGAARH
ncbi:hypothetical protein [Silvimonas iriomotensis]|uniref:hypothetical protein n=1 Tax=Silvimonas iriomotensis TaxID=449662 RepID=UPI00166760FE|nr:hypothetical protein [Silvimonas iriomotensis]